MAVAGADISPGLSSVTGSLPLQTIQQNLSASSRLAGRTADKQSARSIPPHCRVLDALLMSKTKNFMAYMVFSFHYN